ncbi:MAG: methionyl-tRNA formyltransferase [Deltaproteobacteria bacterium]|nr:methionyl-tRNA formyltransferase [Deltaproteobacteria bacterium]
MINTVFMGSPETALPSLRALLEYPGLRVVGVLAQPDRPAGRSRTPQPCPVKAEAQARGLPVFSPESARSVDTLETLRVWAPSLAVVCAYGQILPESILSLPSLGCYNLHFSLLPRWRGASPVQAALLAGDGFTGVTLQRMVKALDAGDVAAQTPPVAITPEDTAQALLARLANLAGTLLAQALPTLLSGTPVLTPQDPAQVTFCRLIGKNDGAADFATESAQTIERKVRAYDPWPGCYVFTGGRRLGLMRVEVDSAAVPPLAPVGVLAEDGRVRCAEGALRLREVKPEGKGVMSFAAFRNGYPQSVGSPLLPKPAAP